MFLCECEDFGVQVFEVVVDEVCVVCDVVVEVVCDEVFWLLFEQWYVEDVFDFVQYFGGVGL